MKMKLLIFLFVIMLVMAMVAGTVQSQDKGSVAPPPGQNIFQKGGAIGYIIVLMSIIGLGLGIEHAVSLRREKLAPPELINELEDLLEEEEYDQALDLCDSDPCPLTNIIGNALPKLASGYDAMASCLQDANDEEALKMFQKISYISLIANLAPMMGLFGTVLGMVGAFEVIATTANPKASELAAGISTALVTTLFGLTCAIPTLVIYSFFKNRVTSMVMDLGNISQELLERFRPIEEG